VSKFVIAPTSPYLNEGYWYSFYMNNKDSAEEIRKYVAKIYHHFCSNGLVTWKSINKKLLHLENI
jgi:predicted DNA-binding protein (MmcQ/YjbR family)